MASEMLDPRDREMVRAVLAPYADRIRLAGVFGSRATGRHRFSSDLDLALYGPLERREEWRIASAFDESYLPITVDVVAYDLLDHPGLKRHIDLVMRPLFTQAELRATPLPPSSGFFSPSAIPDPAARP